MDFSARTRTKGQSSRVAAVAAVVLALLAGLLDPVSAGTRSKSTRGFSIGDATIVEGNAGESLLVFTVTLNGTVPKTATVRYSTASGTAAAPDDYRTVSGILSFPKGVSSRQIAVPVLGDLIDEGTAETMFVSLFRATRTKIIRGQATGTITDDDSPPAVTVSDASAPEGQPGAETVLAFPVRLDRPSGLPVSVRYSTGPGATNPATAGVDYTAVVDGVVTFAPGQTFATADVRVTGDDVPGELEETLTVTLSNPSNATSSGASAIGRIIDNDPLTNPQVSLADQTNAEGATFTFPIAISPAAPTAFKLRYDVVARTAETPGDLPEVLGGELTVPAGSTLVNLRVDTTDDALHEAAETFLVNVVRGEPDGGASIVRGQAVGTITDNDAAPALTVADTEISEGDSTTETNVANFRVRLEPVSGLPATVQWETVDGTAVAGTDYRATTGTLTFPAGTTEQTIAVPILGDVVDGPDRTFSVRLSAPVGATIARSTATATILDDEAAESPEIRVDDPVVTEGDVADVILPFTVGLSDYSDEPVSVNYSITGPGVTVASTKLTFEPGETQRVVSIAVPSDTTVAPDRQYTLTLSSAVDGTITKATGVGTVRENDVAAPAPPNSVSVADATVVEGDSSSTVLQFAVTLANKAVAPLSVDYATASLTAFEGEDFLGAEGTVHFAVGEQEKTVTVAVLADVDDEGDEQLLLDLTSPSAGLSIARGQATGTVTDDDSAALTLHIGDVTVREAAQPTVVHVPVTLSAPAPTGGVTFTWATVTDTATAADFTAADGSGAFAAGAQSTTIPVTVLDDQLDEAPTERFFVDILTVSGASQGRSRGIGTILDNEALLPVVSIGDVTVHNGPDAGTVVVTIPVGLDGPSTVPVTVTYSIPSPTGGAPLTGTIVVPAGATTAVGTHTVVGSIDVVALSPVTLTGATNAHVDPADGASTPAILPVVRIDRVVVTPGEAPGTSIVVIDVSIDRASTEDVVVEITIPAATSGGEATTVEITIPAGQTTGSVQVVVPGSPPAVAANPVTISDVAGAVVSPTTGSATPTVVDLPIVSIGTVTVTPGPTAGTSTVTVEVVLSKPSTEIVTVVVTIPPVAPGGTATTIEITIPAGATTGTGQAVVSGTPTQVAANEVEVTEVVGGVISPSDSSAKPVIGSTPAVPGDKPAGGGSTGGGGTPSGAVDRFTNVATGYRMVASDGGIFTFGDAPFFGSTGDIKLNKPIVGMATTPSGDGYWLVATDGGIFAFGDAGFHGSTGDLRLNRPIVGMETTPSGRGYWLVADDGGIFAFGDAAFEGSTGALRLNKPIVGMETTPSGRGYWLVATDGGIFAFGDARFLGSTGDIRLNQPIVGMAASPSGDGYRLVATDGGIFAFGDGTFLGSTGDIKLNKPIVGMAATPSGGGYWLVATDGGIFTFGDAAFRGSTGDIRLNQPINGMAPVVRRVRV